MRWAGSEARRRRRAGERLAYHAWGWLVGEVAGRVTGKPISQVLAEEVAGHSG